MKLDKSFLGNMAAIMGLQVGLTLLDRHLNGPSESRHEYNENQMRDLIEAARVGNIRGFAKVYRTKRASADDSEVYEKYAEFQRIIAEG